MLQCKRFMISISKKAYLTILLFCDNNYFCDLQTAVLFQQSFSNSLPFFRFLNHYVGIHLCSQSNIFSNERLNNSFFYYCRNSTIQTKRYSRIMAISVMSNLTSFEMSALKFSLSATYEVRQRARVSH